MTGTATIPSSRPLWFRPFLEAIRRELGYSINMNKYAQLLAWADRHSWSRAGGEYPFDALYGICRVLFLEQQRDEDRFQKIFLNYVIDELAFENPAAAPESERTTNQPGHQPTTVRKKDDVAVEAPSLPEPPDDDAATVDTTIRYINLVIPPDAPASQSSGSAGKSRWLLSDAWMPLTRREMVHGWRNLRKQQRSKSGDRLDVPATVAQLAREGLLLDLIFEKKMINSDDLLLILADRRGSMTPFHQLTDILIQTALKEGGHHRAQAYYFYGCPEKVLYQRPNLTAPIPLDEVYARMRPDHTNTLIISDAGAGHNEFDAQRLAMTEAFLYGSEMTGVGLHKRALFVAWLNPMPRHRWAGTTAEAIAASSATPMYSLMDDSYVNFLRTMNKLMGK